MNRPPCHHTLLSLLTCFVLGSALHAQDQTDSTATNRGMEMQPALTNGDKEKKERKVDITILPVVATNPTVGVLFGVLPGLNWNMGTEEDTRSSTALIGIYYTTLNQLFTSLRSNAFTKGDGFNLLTDIRLNINSQPTYGLGSDINRGTIVGGGGDVSDNPYPPISANEMMAFNNFRFYQTVQKRHKQTNFFYGLLLDNGFDLKDYPKRFYLLGFIKG